MLDEAGVTEGPAAAAGAFGTPAPPAQLDAAGLDRLFRTARTRWQFRDEAVSDDTLRRLYDLLKLGPTSANCSPARFLFLRTAEAKQRLRPALSAGNVDKAMSARGWFAGNDELSNETAFRNGTLQGAYLLMAARAMGLDCGPMSGFDNATVDREFLVPQGWRSNFLVAFGYADGAVASERAPRLSFDEACRLL